MKLIDQFLLEIAKLQPLEFAALARIVRVNIYDDSKQPKDFTVVFEEILRAFNKLNRSRRKEIIKVLRAANSQEATINANNTENSETN